MWLYKIYIIEYVILIFFLIFWKIFGKFAKIGQAHYRITAFVVIEENSDTLENYSFWFICVIGEKITLANYDCLK